MLNWCKDLLQSFFGKPTPLEPIIWQEEWSDFLTETVAFYRVLSDEDKALFHQRVLLFWQTTTIESRDTVITEGDRLLVAASAVIPVWGFPHWHYFDLTGVYLLAGPFNDGFECGAADSRYTGMVGSGPMDGKLVLSLPALHMGFKNSKDKHNVGIHEFVHLIDMADGNMDGYPERLKQYAFSVPWFELVALKTKEICKNRSDIDDYALTNSVEFLAVASEYFFESPEYLQKKHPALFAALSEFYQQDIMKIENDIKPFKKSLCRCGSGKKYKHCCLPDA